MHEDLFLFESFRKYLSFLSDRNMLSLKIHNDVPYYRFKNNEQDTLITLRGRELQLIIDKQLRLKIDVSNLLKEDQHWISTLFIPVPIKIDPPKGNQEEITRISSSIHSILKNTYGYDQFRGKQEEIINSIINQQDTLVLMPTGAGKSICFQVPALFLDGVAIVVSPLISLMQNQVMGLKQLGVSAEFINSSQSQEELSSIKKNIKNIKLLYISPERFTSEQFQVWLGSLNISFFAIDEAHCVSTWGHDFRPDYTKLGAIKDKFKKPIIALTATADMRTRLDIPVQLKMKNVNTFISSFDRPNIKLVAEEKDDYKNKLLGFLKEFKGESGIVYCLSRKKVDDIAAFLVKKGYNALPYHAGLSQKERSENQQTFILQENVIVVATIAIGMGIDKPNVRFVIHVDMPQNLESYYQEIGRAGRDGENSTAILLYGLQDFVLRQNMIYTSESKQKMAEMGKLQEMLAFADTISCKRNYLMAYFGDANVYCGNCSSCLSDEEAVNVTSLARDIIKTIKEINQKYGMNYICLLLKGSDSKEVKEYHKEISTFNTCTESEATIKKTIRQLIVLGHLKIDLDSGFNNLVISKEEIINPISIKKDSKKIRIKESNYSKTDEKSDLFDQLKTKRLELAQELGVPPYLILHDKTLKEMAKKKPKDLVELEAIHGWGSKKIEKYGKFFIDFFTNYH